MVNLKAFLNIDIGGGMKKAERSVVSESESLSIIFIHIYQDNLIGCDTIGNF